MTTAATKRKARRNGAKPVKPREVCMLGYAEETRDQVFNLGPDVELWGINMAHAFTFKHKEGKWLPLERLNVTPTDWFQIHPADWASSGNKPTGFFGRPKEHIDFLKGFEGTVWMQSQEIIDKFEIPNGKVFPLSKITELSGRTYITSSFAYQLAMLWYQHVVEKKTVGKLYCYGINLTSMDEYTHQKPCVEYWFGRLEEAGVKIEIPTGSALMKGSVYAQSSDDMSDHAFERLQHQKAKYMDNRDNRMIASAMKKDMEYWVKKVNELVVAIAQKHPDIGLIEDTELKSIVEGAINRRQAFIDGLYNTSTSEALKAIGVIQSESHWLTITGGIDHRANMLPELKDVSDGMAGEVEMPEPRAI